MVLLILMAVLAGGAAPAQPHVVVDPDWQSIPSGADMAEFYPKDAAAKHIEGAATIRCMITAAGNLEACKAIDETPPGAGFGDAAIAMSAKFKMRPKTRDGVPVPGGVVTIPIRFVLPKLDFSAETILHCFGYAAAAAEKTPSSEQAQTNYFMWRLFAEARAVTERVRPSELDSRLSAARQFASRRAPTDDDERRQCESTAERFTESTKGLLTSLRP